MSSTDATSTISAVKLPWFRVILFLFLILFSFEKALLAEKLELGLVNYILRAIYKLIYFH